MIKRIREGTYRQLMPPRSGIDFASNDYLGLAKSSELKALFLQECVSLSQLGSTGSRLLTGNSVLSEEIEASFGEGALLFPTGYMANLALITALATRHDILLYDAQVHASTRDAVRLSTARGIHFRHNSMDHLETLLKKYPKAIVLAESIYSTDGSQAPFEIHDLCERYGARLLLDEAHAFGLFPPRPSYASLYTFGKALGVSGAVVVGPASLKELLIHFGRAFIYTTALPHYSLIAIRTALAYLKRRSDLKEALFSLLTHASLPTPILSLHCSDVKKRAEKLLRKGFVVNALLPPTTPTPQLRITLHAFNTKEEYDALCSHCL